MVFHSEFHGFPSLVHWSLRGLFSRSERPSMRATVGIIEVGSPSTFINPYWFFFSLRSPQYRVLTEPVDSFSPEPRLSYAIRALDNVGKSHVLQVPCQSVTSFMVQALHSSSVRYTPNVQAKKFVDSPHLSNQTGPLQ